MTLDVKINCNTVNPAANSSGLFVFVDNRLVKATWTAGAVPQVFTVTLSVPLQAYQMVKILQFDPAQLEPDTKALLVSGSPAAAPSGGAIPTASAVPVPAGSNCAAPYLPNAPGASNSISVILGCVPDPVSGLQVYINGKLPTGQVTWSLTSQSPITYSGKLPSKLSPGDVVNVLEVNPPQRDPDSPAQTVSAPPAPPAAVYAVQEGSATVSGTAPGADLVRAQIVDGGQVQSVAPDATVDPTTHAFTSTFPVPLQASQRLRLFGVSKTGAVSDSAAATEVDPYGIDWGRVRGYFTGGVILSNNNSQFNLTSANTFLDFNIDKAWLRQQQRIDSIDHGFDWKERFRIHSYFDARLTAIPVGTGGSSSGSAPTLSSGTATSSTGSTGSSSPASTSSTSNPSVNASSLLTNSQAAEIQVGVYLPFVVDNWRYKDRQYSLYLAPIAKVGFYTLTEAGSSVNQQTENANRSNGTFFPFYSYGLRLGHYREHTTWDLRNDRDRAPEQLSYIDVSVGKWANYEYIQPFAFTNGVTPMCTLPVSDPTTAACDLRTRDWRYGFEGLLVVPNTPLILGLSANVAAQHPRGAGAYYLVPPDDLRFLFGVRFDASRFTSVLSKLGGQ